MVNFKFLLFWKKQKKIDPPESGFGIIKVNEIAKEQGLLDDENKIIELNRGGKITKIKYSEADVEELQKQGIPVIPEEYSEDYEFVNAVDFGHVEYRR